MWVDNESFGNSVPNTGGPKWPNSLTEYARLAANANWHKFEESTFMPPSKANPSCCLGKHMGLTFTVTLKDISL
jgi:hypothetical protein